LGEVAKPNHTVPRLYLRGFANDAEQITTVRLPGDGRLTQAIEKSTSEPSEIEGSAVSVLRAIESGAWPLSKEQRGTLATFIAAQAGDASDHLPPILGRPWKLFRFQRRSLITCDSPVGLVAAPDAETSQGVGFSTAWAITFPMTRRLGLVMGDITPLTEANVPLERVRTGGFDAAEQGTTIMQKFINESTMQSASEYLYHHPDDDFQDLTRAAPPRI
jgi:Protein of unknown function (DUF4238)